jgi:hypothetical protein
MAVISAIAIAREKYSHARGEAVSSHLFLATKGAPIKLIVIYAHVEIMEN